MGTSPAFMMDLGIDDDSSVPEDAARRQAPIESAAGGRRIGVRTYDAAEERHYARSGALLYLVCGAGILLVWLTAPGWVSHPTAYVASGIVVVSTGLVVLASSVLLLDSAVVALFPPMVITMTFGGALAIPLILYVAGYAAPGAAFGVVIYGPLLIFGFWLLSRRLAIALLATVGIGHALLVSLSPGVVAPVSLWVFLLGVLAAAGFLLGGLVDRFDQVARSEVDAREALADTNRYLEERVAEQVDELQRVSQLRRFLSPQVADAVMSSGRDSFLNAHRREIAVFFCDLRGFTAFAGRVEPEEVVAVLNDYYDVVGTQLHKFEATVGSFIGDGIMAYLNDPHPCDEPAKQAVEMALGMNQPMRNLCREWDRRGYDLGYGIGIAFGHATLGVIGFEGRNDYSPAGTVVNLASRLCDEAAKDQILIDRRTHAALPDQYEIRQVDDKMLKGFPTPIAAFEVVGQRTSVST